MIITFHLKKKKKDVKAKGHATQLPRAVAGPPSQHVKGTRCSQTGTTPGKRSIITVSFPLTSKQEKRKVL